MLLVVLGIAAGARSSSAGAPASSLPRTGRSRRRWSGSRTAAARSGPSGSGCRRRATRRSPPWTRRARAALRHAVDEDATGLVLFRETTIAGSFAGLGGVERLRERVTLRSGRLPQPCTRERCEVLRLRGEGRIPRPEGLRLVEVGEAVLKDRVLFGDFLAPTDNALEYAEVSPVLARAAGTTGRRRRPSSWPRVSRCSPGRLRSTRSSELRLGGAARSGPGRGSGRSTISPRASHRPRPSCRRCRPASTSSLPSRSSAKRRRRAVLPGGGSGSSAARRLRSSSPSHSSPR